MTKMNKKKTISLALVALVLIATLNIGNALAYFTDFTLAKGNKELELGFAETELIEKIEPGKKVIQIKNTGSTEEYDYPAMVRLKAFAGNKIIFTFTPENTQDWNYNTNDGYWYYNHILKVGDITTPITITFNQPSDVDSYNVIVVQECTPVLYDNDGNEYAEWDATMMDSPEDTTKGPVSELK